MVDIIKSYATRNLCYIAAKKMVPKGIVVHSTGANNKNLKRYVDHKDRLGVNIYNNHWNNKTPGGRKVCVHAFIGYDKNEEICVAEILPLNICCWGVGSGKNGSYNYSPAYIQFEICEDSLNDKEYYKKVFAAAAQYCVHLCKNFNIDVSNIVGHCEAYKRGYGSNHSDPEHWMKKHGETMDDFRKMVSSLLNEDNIKVEADTPKDTAEFHKGDLVKISDDAVYYTEKPIPQWVKKQNWFISEEPHGDRAIIDKNQNNTNSINSPISTKYLTLVKKNQTENNMTKLPYRVKVLEKNVFIYKDAGENNTKTGIITDKGVYTITLEKTDSKNNKWGKLKSGAGWIMLKNVERI